MSDSTLNKYLFQTTEVTFIGRQSAFHKQKRKTDEMPFVTSFHPGVKNVKQILKSNEKKLKTVFQTPMIISYTRGKTVKTSSLEPKFEG